MLGAVYRRFRYTTACVEIMIDNAMALEPYDLQSETHPEGVVIRELSERPRLYLAQQFLTDHECAHLIRIARPRLVPAMAYNRATGSGQQVYNRNNTYAMLSYYEDEVVSAIEERISKLTGYPKTHSEAIQVLHYNPGEAFLPHYDFFPPQEPGFKKHLEIMGQRMITVLMYLNHVTAGGETDFPKIGIRVMPQPGSALVLHNTLDDGEPDMMSLHAGSPVVEGEKWLAVTWIHQQIFPITNSRLEQEPFRILKSGRSDSLFFG